MKNQFKTREQLAQELGISRKTLLRMLKRHEINLPKGLISPEWAAKICTTLGIPENRIGKP